MSIFLELRELNKVYGYRAVLNALDYDILENCINIVTGENGAGKSTLLNIISGVTRPDKGKFKLKNKTVDSPRDYLPYTAYLSSKLFLYEDLSIEKNINFFCGLKNGISPSRQATYELFSRFKLENYLTFPIKKLSTGMAKKAAIGCVLLQNAELLILDEPYSSLDVESCRILTELLSNFVNSGGTVMMTTHQNIPPFDVMNSSRHLKHGKMLVTAG